MNDMSAVIVPKSDQINADDLIAGPMTITITGVEIRPGTEQPVSIRFDGDNGKPWKPCKSMSRVLVALWGADANKYVGRAVTLYRDPAVKWGGLEVGGIRVSHASNLDKATTMPLTVTKGKRSPYVVKPLQAPAKAAQSGPAFDQDDDLTFDQSSAKAWLASLAKHLDAATTRPAVDAIVSNPQVARQMREWPQQGQDQITKLIQAALNRVQFDPPSADDDDGFPGVVSDRAA